MVAEISKLMTSSVEQWSLNFYSYDKIKTKKNVELEILNRIIHIKHISKKPVTLVSIYSIITKTLKNLTESQ